jgi:hypothetical protein
MYRMLACGPRGMISKGNTGPFLAPIGQCEKKRRHRRITLLEDECQTPAAGPVRSKNSASKLNFSTKQKSFTHGAHKGYQPLAVRKTIEYSRAQAHPHASRRTAAPTRRRAQSTLTPVDDGLCRRQHKHGAVTVPSPAPASQPPTRSRAAPHSSHGTTFHANVHSSAHASDVPAVRPREHSGRRGWGGRIGRRRRRRGGKKVERRPTCPCGGGWERVARWAAQNATFSLATLFMPNTGRRASYALHHPVRSSRSTVLDTSYQKKGAERKWAGGRTPNDGQRVSMSVLFTREMLVNAVRRRAPALSTRSQIGVGRRCSDCL